MIDLLSTGRSKKNISVKYLLITLFVCISMVAWLGISDLRADKGDPENNTNDAQTKRLENVANEAALQDPEVINLIEDGDIEGAEKKYDDNVEAFTEQISDWRALGMGWGDIVHKLNREYEEYDLNIHPSVLGLGHSPKSFEEAFHSSKHSSMKSGNNQGQGLALGHSKDNSSNRGGGNGGGKGGGNGGGKGGGKK
jgi:hypothetical protein